MSLINNMLKDLEKRENNPQVVAYVPNISLAQKKPFYKKYKAVWIGLLLALTLLGLIAVMLRHPSISNPSVTLPEQPHSLATPEVKPDDSWLQPASVTGISLQVKDKHTEISFLLNHPTLYRLTSNNRHELSLFIDNAQLQAALPVINEVNSALQGISSQTTDSHIKIKLVLNPGADIQSIRLSDDAKNPALVIALDYHPENDHLITNLAAKVVKTPAMRSLLLQHYKNALDYAEKGDYASAIKKLSDLLIADPMYQEARVSLIALLIDQGDPAKAKKWVSEGLRLNPDYAPFTELKARILVNEGKLEEALSLLQSATPNMRENPDYHAFIAALYERTNNDLLAVKLYKQLLSINASNANWWFGLGISLDKLGEVNAAIGAYSRALAEGHVSADAITYIKTRMRTLEGKTHDATD